MKKIAPFQLIVLLLAVVLLVTACGSKQPAKRELYTGSNGLRMSFPEQNNFQQFESDDFSIAVRLENDGAEPVKTTHPGFLNIIYDPSTLTLVASKSNLKLSGGKTPALTSIPFSVSSRTYDNPVNGVEYIDFTFTALDLPENRPQLDSPITFQACYPYVTTFIQNVCVDRDFFRQDPTQTCISREFSAQSQGAPVAVSHIEPRFTRVLTPAGNSVIKPRFKITMTNLQDGYVIFNESQKSPEVCTLDDFNKALYGNVSVSAKLSSIPLSCGINGVTRFVGRTAEIVCEVPEDTLTKNAQVAALFETGANYEAPLTIELRYFYISQLMANVQVERP